MGVVIRGAVQTVSFVPTTSLLAPLAWMITCAAIIVSYARKPGSPDLSVTKGRLGRVPRILLSEPPHLHPS